MKLNPEAQHPITGFDLYLMGEGNHFKSYEKFGARLMNIQGVQGVYFALWAPNARGISVVGNFNNWQQDTHPMNRLDSSGVWELFIPGLKEGEIYKYAITSADNHWHLKADPYAFQAELRPQTASIVCSLEKYAWRDDEWMKQRSHQRLTDAPMSIYEVHLGSWKTTSDMKFLNYRLLAEEIVAYVLAMGYTHIELLPVMEHPLDESWGYQIINYYAPTSRFGAPEDFMYFVDACHQNGIGVILDWVPGHFPRDEHGLANFDGQQIYAYPNWKKGEHKEWGTLVFDFGRREVSNFLISNACFWLEKYHVDGLRVDAVASMLYLDYARSPGEWEPNIFGGHENLEAINFIKQLNTVVHADHPGILMIAEESTSWPHVTHPVNDGGLGFDMKWNMGWMHDTLDYFSKDPIYRKYHQGKLTFSLVYAFSENFILPISHDEVVYGKKSLLSKMPGDDWQKFANARLFLSYMFAHPGKKLSFMTNDIGQWKEWDSRGGLDWGILEQEMNQKFHLFVKDLQFLYKKYPAFYQQDFNFHGFEWIDFSDIDQSVISFLRWSKDYKEVLIFTFNMTPVPRHSYRIGVPYQGVYEEILNSDAAQYGGSGVGNFGGVTADQYSLSWETIFIESASASLGSQYFLSQKGNLKMEKPWPTMVIENVSPCIDDGCFSVKCTVGEKFLVEADIFKDGHDVLQAALLFKRKERMPDGVRCR